MIVPRTTNAVAPAIVSQTSFAGGMHDRDHPSLLSDNEYFYGKNLELRNGGLAALRRPRRSRTAQLGAGAQGAKFFDPLAANAVIVIVANGRVYKWEGTGSAFTLIDAGVLLSNTTRNVEMEILNGRIYIYSGPDDNVYSWDGLSATLTDEGNANTNPPRGRVACQQSNRIFVGDVDATGAIAAANHYFFPSSINNGQVYDRASNNQINPSNGTQPITAMGTYRKQEILVFTNNTSNVWDVGGTTITGDNGFQHITLDSNIGCKAARSLVVVGEDAFFLSADRQVRTIKRTINDIAYGVSIPVTYLVPNLMDRINPNYAHLAAGVYFDNYYLLAVALDNSTVNNAVIVFDTLHQIQAIGGSIPACVGEWTNISANQWIVANFNGVPALYYLDATVGSIVQMFSGTEDDGTAIPFEIQTKAFDMNYPMLDKTAHGGEVQVIDTVGSLEISYAKDAGTFTVVKTETVGDTTSAILPISLPFTLPGGTGIGPVCWSMYRRGRSRYWQLRFKHSGERLSIKQFSLRAWVESLITVC